MIIKKNEDKVDTKDKIIKLITKNVEGDNYILRIYFSKDNELIIFKIEPEKIDTYYYYEKFDLVDFQQFKRYKTMKDLNEVFENLKFIVFQHHNIEDEPDDIQSLNIKLEKDLSKMKISFLSNLEVICHFTLRKKIISQNRLNPIFVVSF